MRRFLFPLLLLSCAAQAAERPVTEVAALPEAECAPLRQAFERAMGADVGLRMEMAAVDPDHTRTHGLIGTRCRLWTLAGGQAVQATGIKSLFDLYDRLDRALSHRGLRETARTLPFAADGPDGSVFARERAGTICLVSIHLQDFRKDGGAPMRPRDHAYDIDIGCFRPSP